MDRRSLLAGKEERSSRAVAVTALSSSASAVLEEADGVAVGVLHRDDLPAAADVTDLPLHLPAGVQQHLHAALDVLDVQVRDGPGHAAAVAVGVQPDVLVVDLEADVVRLVRVRLDAEELGERGLRLRRVGDGEDEGLEAFAHRVSPSLIWMAVGADASDHATDRTPGSLLDF